MSLPGLGFACCGSCARTRVQRGSGACLRAPGAARRRVTEAVQERSPRVVQLRAPEAVLLRVPGAAQERSPRVVQLRVPEAVLLRVPGAVRRTGGASAFSGAVLIRCTAAIWLWRGRLCPAAGRIALFFCRRLSLRSSRRIRRFFRRGPACCCCAVRSAGSGGWSYRRSISNCRRRVGRGASRSAGCNFIRTMSSAG